MKKSLLINILLVAIIHHGISQNTNSGFSPPVIIDTEHPQVQVLSPSGGEVFNFLLPMPVNWQAYDAHPAVLPINIGFSTVVGGDTLLAGDGFANTGAAEVLPPQVTSEAAKVYVKMTDAFGNVATAASNGFFSLTGCIPLSVYAGMDATICEESSYFITNAVAENFDNLTWTTSGDGTFNNPYISYPEYYPGPLDKSSGSVSLTLTAAAIAPCEASASDEIILHFQKSPVAFSGIDAMILEGEPYFLFDAYAENYSSVFWSTSGDGTFSSIGSLNPIYNPGPLDIDNQSVILQMTVMPLIPCTENATDQMVLNIQRKIISHSIDIPVGWSGLSSYINPLDESIEGLFESIVNEIIIVQNETGMYWPGQNINTIINWNSHQGYQIKVNQNVNLTLSGIYENNKVLQPVQGWNLIPVLSECQVEVTELFNQPSMVIIKEVAGSGIYWPAMGINSLRFVKPGKAYYVLFSTPEEIVFPVCAKNSTIISNKDENTETCPWKICRPTIQSHVVAIPLDVTHAFSPGDFIGAFNQDGLCCGYMQIGKENGSIIVYSDDPLTAMKDGFTEDELLNFRLYRMQFNDEVNLDFTFSPDFPNRIPVFRSHGLSVIEQLKTKIEGNHEKSYLVIHPNPAKDYFNISTDAGSPEKVEITIINSEGIIVNQLILNDIHIKVDISNLVPGFYMIQIKSNESSWNRQLIKY